MRKHVDIGQAGRTLAVPEGVTILEAALADGIAYPHGCRSGFIFSRVRAKRGASIPMRFSSSAQPKLESNP